MAKEKAPKAYKDWQIEDIIAWCQANNQVEWLKTTAAKNIKRNIYPKVPHVSKTGKHTMVQDKKAEPIGTETTPITFVELKREFVATFFEKKEKAKKTSMYDIIKGL